MAIRRSPRPAHPHWQRFPQARTGSPTEGSVADALHAVAEAARAAAANADLAVSARRRGRARSLPAASPGPAFLSPRSSARGWPRGPRRRRSTTSSGSRAATRRSPPARVRLRVFVVPVRHRRPRRRLAGAAARGRGAFDEDEREAARLTAAQAALALRVFEAERVPAASSRRRIEPGGRGARRPAATRPAAPSGSHGSPRTRPARPAAPLAQPSTTSSSSACGDRRRTTPGASPTRPAPAARGSRPDRREAGDLVAVSPAARPAGRSACSSCSFAERPADAELARSRPLPPVRRRRCAQANGRASCAASSSARATSSRSSARRPHSSRSRTRSRPRSTACRSCSTFARSRIYLRDGGPFRDRRLARTSPGRTRSSPSVCSTLRSARSGRAGSSPPTTPRTTAASRAFAPQRQEAGIEAAHAVPLVAHGDVIGLLAVYPPRGRALDRRPVGAAGGARRPDRRRGPERAACTRRRSCSAAERERALDAERSPPAGSRRLYEISRSFAQSLSLDEHAGRGRADAGRAARGRCRGDPPARRARRVARRAGRPRLERRSSSRRCTRSSTSPTRSSRARAPAARRGASRSGSTRRSAAELGRSHRLLVPFLERGSTAAVIPIATPPSCSRR